MAHTETEESTATYAQVIKNLRQSYDSGAEARDRRAIPAWKIEVRDSFLSLLQQEGMRSLLEIGAGSGHYSKFFQDSGLEVVCTDLSPEMVRLCRAKGLAAHVMDFLDLDFPDGCFDAVFALNCLLHVPKVDLLRVLRAVRAVLKPGGLFYLGLYGGRDFEGIYAEDGYEPKRFFSFHTDQQMREAVSRFFELLTFKQIILEAERDVHVQSMILRR